VAEQAQETAEQNSIVEAVARRFHPSTDHARDGERFGGPYCNCKWIARRVVPMLAEAHDDGFYGRGKNPYRREGDQR